MIESPRIGTVTVTAALTHADMMLTPPVQTVSQLLTRLRGIKLDEDIES